MVESPILSHLTVCHGSIFAVYIKFVLVRLVQCLSLDVYFFSFQIIIYLTSFTLNLIIHLI